MRYCGYFGLDLGVDIRDEEDIEFDEDEYTLSIEDPIATISIDNPSLNICYDGDNSPSSDYQVNMELVLRVSGVFDDDVGLQGDMNDDDSLDVLDVVALVEIILNGGVGDVGDLLNIVRG